jgi:hypothetical protein
MPLTLHPATSEDVEHIADLHLKSFDSNPLLHVQFPTPEALESLRGVLRREMLDVVTEKQPAKVILVVKEGERIVSFAKWDLPVSDKRDENEGRGEKVKKAKDGEKQGRDNDEVGWHEDVRREYLVRYHERADAAMVRVLGEEGKRCYSKILFSFFGFEWCFVSDCYGVGVGWCDFVSGRLVMKLPFRISNDIEFD